MREKINQKYVIIVAGGKGLRMNSTVPKQFLLLNGKPLLMHTIEAFYRYDPAITIILVLSKEEKQYWHSLCQTYQFEILHRIVDGGISRFYSVKNGLLSIEKKTLVAVHDGVRPLIDQALISVAFEKAAQVGAVYPAIPITDTLRQVFAQTSKVMDRNAFFLVQTPQVFFSSLLINAYREASSDQYTDDSSVVEDSKSCIPLMIKGNQTNIKITTPMDLFIAQMILEYKRK